MKGRIVKFIEPKGYGFIAGDDGKTRFFHVSQLQFDQTDISVGSSVTFTSTTTEKGDVATKIYNVKEHVSSSESKFIEIGGTRLKKTNIKAFRVFTERRDKVEEELVVLENKALRYLDYVLGETELGMVFHKVKETKVVEETEYLVVKTYQNEKYQWTGQQIDIAKAVQKLESA